MNDINQIVFEVYQGVCEMDYLKNEKKSIIRQLKKLVRYILSGYIFSLKSVKKGMSEPNMFHATEKVYHALRFAVYTVSTGKYDEVKEPIYIDDRIDYYVFTDQDIPE